MGKRSLEDSSESTASSEERSRDDAASPAKIQEIEADFSDPQVHRMQCSLPPHRPISFNSTNDFEVHYAKEHMNRCSACGKNFPSAHYLTLHIDENHNSVREALAAAGEKTFGCFIEDCDRKCSTPQKRRLHLIDKHMFPKAYNFRIIDQGIDKTGSMLLSGPRRRLSTSTSGSYQHQTIPPPLTTISDRPVAEDSVAVSSTTPTRVVKDDSVNELEESMAALRFVPSSVQSRQRGQKKAK